MSEAKKKDEAVEAQIVELKPSQVQVLHRRAHDVAGACRQIVMATAQSIPGAKKKHVKVEGWQAIANMFGCVPTIKLVEKVDGGIRSVACLTMPATGDSGERLVVEAEGFVGDDEPKWRGSPEYAKRGMAQTRAISRVCRSAFAFVVVLIDAEQLSTTPFEEAEGLHVDNSEAPPKGIEGLKARVEAARAQAPQPPPPSPARARKLDVATAAATHDRTMSFGFGRDKGVALSQIEVNSLRWYATCFERDLEDPSKERFHQRTQEQLDAVEAELAARGVL